MAAGAAVGHWNLDGPHLQIPATKYDPKFTDDERDVRYTKWKMAVERAMGWDI